MDQVDISNLILNRMVLYLHLIVVSRFLLSLGRSDDCLVIGTSSDLVSAENITNLEHLVLRILFSLSVHRCSSLSLERELSLEVQSLVTR